MSEINKINNVALDKLIVIAKEIENATKNMNLGNRMPNNLYALQELKERREADKKPLDIKDQLRIVRDRCPDIWQYVRNNVCVKEIGIVKGGTCLKDSCDACDRCYSEALKEGKE